MSDSGSRRLRAVQPAIIPQVLALMAERPGTVSLAHGMVRHGPPPQVRERVATFWADPENHKYGAVPGQPELIDALKEKLRRDNGVAVDAGRRVIVTAGSNMAFFQIVLAITDPGDQIVLLSPYYFNHEMAVRIADCKPVAVATDEAFQPVVPAIRQAVGERTRAIVTISPNNPTAAVYPRHVLHAINELCREHGIYHISDEAYEYFTYGTAEHVSPGSFPAAGEHTISLFSLSKSYGFASWRIGYVVIPAALEAAVMKIQDTNVICPPVISQHAALGALAAGAVYCRRHVAELAEVRDLVLGELGKLGSLGAGPIVAEGAFYVLLGVDTELSDIELNTRLIRDFGVAALPGRTFGVDGRCTLRLSYGALESDTVAEGFGRLLRGLRSICGG